MNILSYHEYEKINEKISWKQVLLICGILYGTQNYYSSKQKPKISEYEISTINKFFDDIDNPKYFPSKEDSIMLENNRKEMLSWIEKTSFSEKKKKLLIDSIKTIQFRISEDDSTTAGTFVPLKLISKDLSKYSNYSKINSNRYSQIVLINNKYLKNKLLKQTILHELTHYVDYLLGNENNEYLSNEIHINKYIDKKIFVDIKNNGINITIGYTKNIKDSIDYKHIFSKLSFICNKSNKRKITKKLESITKSLYPKPKLDYYSSEHELFTRFFTLKRDIYTEGLLDNIDDHLTKKIFDEYLLCKNFDSEDSQEINEIIDFLVVLDWSKIEEIDNKIRNSFKKN